MDRATIARTLGAKLKEARLAAGLSQDAVARRCGMLRPNLSRLEHGVHTPDVVTAVRCARAIGVPVAELFAALDEVV